MGLPRLETCCFVFDIKTGNIILGSVSAFLSFVMLVVMIVAASTFGSEKQALEEIGIRNATFPTATSDIELQAAITGLYAMTIILVLMYLFKIFFDLFFVYGVVKERAAIIKAYCITWIVFFLLSTFVFFLNSPNYSAGTICSEIFYIGLNVYAVLLSYSFYKQLNLREEL